MPVNAILLRFHYTHKHRKINVYLRKSLKYTLISYLTAHMNRSILLYPYVQPAWFFVPAHLTAKYHARKHRQTVEVGTGA